ncbi:unnamed protein product [Coffea canephora]|uniref:RING-type domain-containing protein n=2 Tax=Coffea TaxID=13442 RepID=A0A068U6S8_COFCA|nr:E3 ubiquitin-protein ligase RNF4-like isoform X1 [Coffea arabica]CDP03899.1 unnamed protein product [Coffea canephora]
MSTQGHRTYSRSQRRRKTGLNVDLNAVPPNDNRDLVGPSARSQSRDYETSWGAAPIPPCPIDLEAIDDDVMISSPRAFAEAKNNSRRNHERVIVVDVDSDERSSRGTQNGRNKHRRVSANQTFINCDLYINLEGASNSGRDNVNSMVSQPLPPPPPPKEPTFNCPVCMGPLVEEMSTKCGHIFCKACIKSAIAAQNKCPTCRRKVTTKDIIRVYLPAAS